jgi:hypothetical protein
MGLLDKGYGQRDVEQKRNASTSIFWKIKKKKVEKYHARGFTSCPLCGRTPVNVFLLTIIHEDEFVEAPSSSGLIITKKQTILLDYNKYKTGEDRLDQMLSYYSFERKMIKWWKKLFLHLYNLAVVSAHILHTKTNKRRFHWKFKKKLPKDC